MLLWIRRALLIGFLILACTGLGMSAVQADATYYYRWAAPSPLTVTCTNLGYEIKAVVNGTLYREYNLPASGGHYILEAYRNGAPLVRDDRSLAGSSRMDLTGLNGEGSGYPLSYLIRYQTYIGNQRVYVSTLSYGCTGDGTFPVTIVNEDTTIAGFIDDGRINPQNFAPVALYCDGSVLNTYAIDDAGKGQFAWSFDFKNASAADLPLISQDGMTLSKREDGRYYLLAPQQDGKQYLFIFDGCPSPGTTEVYVSDPLTGDFVQTN